MEIHVVRLHGMPQESSRGHVCSYLVGQEAHNLIQSQNLNRPNKIREHSPTAFMLSER